MKRILLLTLLACALPAAAQTNTTRAVRLVWDPEPDEDTNGLWFQVWTSTNIALPLTNWTVITNFSAALIDPAAPGIRLDVVPGRAFYTLTASNFWGRGDFSNVASTPALPRSDKNLQIERLP